MIRYTVLPLFFFIVLSCNTSKGDDIEHKPTSNTSSTDNSDVSENTTEAETPKCIQSPIMQHIPYLEGEVCQEADSVFRSIPDEDKACTIVDDCMIYETAGRCMGIALSKKAQPTYAELPQPCVNPEIGECPGVSRDHVLDCIDGCCVLLEK